jgi:hypothetical protein
METPHRIIDNLLSQLERRREAGAVAALPQAGPASSSDDGAELRRLQIVDRVSSAMAAAVELPALLDAVCTIVSETTACGEVHMFVSKAHTRTRHSCWEHKVTTGNSWIENLVKEVSCLNQASLVP